MSGFWNQAFDLTGRCAVITGGAAGIGLACASLLVERGARVALLDRLAIAAAAFRAAPDPARLRLPCVLLGNDDRCTVYEVRPLSCRAFTSRSLPRCQQVVFGDAKGGVEQNAGHFRIFTEATFALEQAAKERGMAAGQQGLVAALLEETGHQPVTV